MSGEWIQENYNNVYCYDNTLTNANYFTESTKGSLSLQASLSSESSGAQSRDSLFAYRSKTSPEPVNKFHTSTSSQCQTAMASCTSSDDKAAHFLESKAATYQESILEEKTKIMLDVMKKEKNDQHAAGQKIAKILAQEYKQSMLASSQVSTPMSPSDLSLDSGVHSLDTGNKSDSSLPSPQPISCKNTEAASGEMCVSLSHLVALLAYNKRLLSKQNINAGLLCWSSVNSNDEQVLKLLKPDLDDINNKLQQNYCVIQSEQGDVIICLKGEIPKSYVEIHSFAELDSSKLMNYGISLKKQSTS